jgi:hypothetical protein
MEQGVNGAHIEGAAARKPLIMKYSTQSHWADISFGLFAFSRQMQIK